MGGLLVFVLVTVIAFMFAFVFILAICWRPHVSHLESLQRWSIVYWQPLPPAIYNWLLIHLFSCFFLFFHFQAIFDHEKAKITPKMQMSTCPIVQYDFIISITKLSKDQQKFLWLIQISLWYLSNIWNGGYEVVKFWITTFQTSRQKIWI